MSLQKGLVGHWPLDSRYTQNGVTKDISGMENHATLRNGVTTGATGQLGEGLDFDGSDDYLPIQGLVYDTQGEIQEFTASIWTKLSSGGTLVGYDRSEYYRLENNQFSTYGPSGGIHDQPMSNIVDSSWHHVVFWYDSDSSGDNKRVYIDDMSTPDASNASPHSGAGLGSGTPRYGFIGDDSEADTFDGSANSILPTGIMDDIRIWHRALSEDERKRLNNMQELQTWRV